tara:strand:- start:16970 stop:18298 length:1329 start_codon:yes stop_codon:yes gene_type:complete
MIFDNLYALQSRFKLLLSSLIDFVIIQFIFYIYIPNEHFFKIGVRQSFYILFWILISYIFDRYYQNKVVNDQSHLLYQFLNSLKSIFTFGFFFLVYNWILGNYTGRSFLLIILLNLFIFSSSAQYLLNRFFFSKFIKSKYWAFLISKGLKRNQLNLDLLKEEKIKIIYIDDIKSINNIILDSYGIVLGNYDNLSQEEINSLLDLKKRGIRIYKLSTWLKRFLKRYPPNLLSLKDFINVEFLLLTNSLLMRVKRLGDILLSIILLILSLPVIFISAIFIFIEDGGPIFYSQRRTGYLNSQFTIWKLRSMEVDAEKKGIRWSSKDDQRITKVGAIIRKMRIDELPQLLSVFLGDMSLIGPRPERPEIDQLLMEQIPFYSMRYLLRPGLSGWAQVNYPYGASVYDSSNKLSYDLYYITNYSFWLDILIFLRTLRLIFNARGSKPN